MSTAEYSSWIVEAIPKYAAGKVKSGQWSQEASVDLSTREYNELLPQGLETLDNHFFTIFDHRAQAVGMLWFAVKTKFDARVAYVLDVSVRPERRRQGYAYRAFIDLEKEVRKLGLAGIALHVFGYNTSAQALYAKLGFYPTNVNLYKAVEPADA